MGFLKKLIKGRAVEVNHKEPEFIGVSAEVDPFYSDENMNELEKRARDLKEGRAVLKEHGLINPEDEALGEPIFTVSIKRGVPEKKHFGELPCFDFGKQPGVLGCFLNYEPRTLEPPTEKQIAQLERDGVMIPEGATKQDASAMISRCESGEPQPLPSAALIELADHFGCEYSAFVGWKDLMDEIIWMAKDNKAALYCYAVACAKRGRDFGNMYNDPALSLFMSFNEIVAADPSLQKSLADRWPDDFRKPNKGTKVYKAAVAHLAGGGIV